MNRVLAPAVVPAVLLGALVALAGCGDATGSSAADAGAADPTGAPTSAAVTTTTASLAPTWPATGCESHVMSSIDYARAPKGWKTPEEAVAHATGDLPSGAVVVAPSEPGDPVTAWVVDDAGTTILATVTFASSGTGLYVDSIERCA